MPKVLKMPFTGCTPRWPVRLITVVPYVDKYDLKISPFLSAEAAYGRIIGDLKAAEEIMSENGEYFENADQQNNEFLKDRQIHMNLYAIQGMLARVYWMKGDLKTAAEYAQKVLDCGYFELADKSEIEFGKSG